MTIGPITYLEIAAYDDKTLALLRAWDVALIRRLDTEVRALTNSPHAPGEIPVSDGRGVTNMLRGLAAKQNAIQQHKGARA